MQEQTSGMIKFKEYVDKRLQQIIVNNNICKEEADWLEWLKYEMFRNNSPNKKEK